MWKTSVFQMLLIGLLFASCAGQEKTGAKTINTKSGWNDVKTIELKGLKVSLSKPVLVARSKGYLWFPTLIGMGNGELLTVMSTMADAFTDKPTCSVAWSLDEGLTWDKPRNISYGECSLHMPDGNRLLLPYYLFPRNNGMGAACQMVVKNEREIRVLEDEVSVTGWPRPDRSVDPKFGLAGFVFNGQTVKLKDGGYLATLYGYFKDTQRYSLVVAESFDGKSWRIRSVVADENCKLQGSEGPCESALCRLKDGRLMCVFRMMSGLPYGQCWSRDEGKTWTTPVSMDEAHSVQPSLAVMQNGAVALSGGRPGIYLWINGDGTGTDWQAIDVQKHHNLFCPEEPIDNSSCYTEIVILDDTHLLLVYDRIPHGWEAIPEDTGDSNSVWVVRIGITSEK